MGSHPRRTGRGMKDYTKIFEQVQEEITSDPAWRTHLAEYKSLSWLREPVLKLRCLRRRKKRVDEIVNSVADRTLKR